LVQLRTELKTRMYDLERERAVIREKTVLEEKKHREYLFHFKARKGE